MFRRALTAACAVALVTTVTACGDDVISTPDTQKFADSVDWEVPGQIQESAASELPLDEAMGIYTAYSQAMLDGDVPAAQHYADEKGVIEHNGPTTHGGAHPIVTDLEGYADLLRSTTQYLPSASLSNPQAGSITDAPGGKMLVVNYDQRTFDTMGQTAVEPCQRGYFLKFTPSPDFPQAGAYTVSGIHDTMTCDPETVNSTP